MYLERKNKNRRKNKGYNSKRKKYIQKQLTIFEF